MISSELRSRVKANLDDPTVAAWALQRIQQAASAAQRTELFEAWFADDRLVRRWLRDGDPAVLSLLSRELPPERFAPFERLLVKRWRHWGGHLAAEGARILASIAPVRAARLFEARLKHAKRRSGTFDRLAVEGILESLELLRPGDARALRPLAEEVLGPPSELEQWSVLDIPASALAAGELPGERIREIFRYNSLPRLEQQAFQLAEGLAGHAAFFVLAADVTAGRRSAGFDAVRALFADPAVAGRFDELLRTSPAMVLPELLAELRQLGPAPGGRALAELFGEGAWRELPDGAAGVLRDLAVALRAEHEQQDPAAFAGLGLEELLDLAALPVPPAPFHTPLFEALATHPVQAVARGLENRLWTARPRERLQLVEAAGELARPELVPFLEEVFEGDPLHAVAENAARALAKTGEPAVEALVRRWDELPAHRWPMALEVFQAVPDERVRSFLLDRADELMEQAPVSWAWATVGAPDPAFVERLAPLLDEANLDEAEPDLVMVFHLLCRFLDLAPPELEDASVRLRRIREAEVPLWEGPDPIEDAMYLRIPLRCPACDSVARYRVERVYLDQKTADQERVAPDGVADEADASIYVADELPCHACRELVDFEATGEARATILAEARRVLESEEEDPFSPVHLVDARLIGGRSMSIDQAVAHYRRKLEEDEDPVALLGLANVFRHLGREGSAERLYHRALAREPGLVEASLSLADMYSDGARPRESFAVLRAALDHEDRWRYHFVRKSQRRDARVDLYLHYDDLRQFLQAWDAPKAIPDPVEPRRRGHEKVGRNEPCPCGSGKKYKKCCGARR